ncbi:hypothetical protein BKA63DRAFT_515011 [Paraphoma chrysanthemicola]|nr:hypothetical protein BKA63DRAFT_515011 [Paraphoma chrysanthemicola]
MPTSGAKHLNHADIEHMFDSSRSSTPSKHASEKCRLSSLYTEDELASSPSEPIVPLTHDTKAVDAMDITPLPTQHSSKPKLDFGVIPTLRPKIAITVPATPSHKTRSRRADLPQESPSRKSARSTAKPVSYRESALAALIVSPEKAIEKHENKDDLRASGVSPLTESTRTGGRGGAKGKGRMGSDSFAASPSKKIVVKDVKEAGV